MARKKSIIDTMGSSEFCNIIKRNTSIRDVLIYLGFRPSSGTMHNKIRSRIKREGIDDSHMERKSRNETTKIPLNEILVKNSNYSNRHRLKIRLVNEGVLEYKCYGKGCNVIDFWNEKPISLQLDHKNGNPTDNRKENLRFLCPNCHSQTHNFSGKNKIKKMY